ncbi:thiamine diphosphokinase [Paenibacillus physcomitrellae]|uniref:Thiamine diphosphokinase n=1 Tax=Paenibacillus physcomitrellae TaxID=1619311 RepID=A0ABQ1FRG1_9BACL|nr:thiamine diphosphokinase [Paenibacillus physcomitrellae]GGA25046.1 thiamine pyrophosphokinase [Paenibacillus physcomitrellae]
MTSTNRVLIFAGGDIIPDFKQHIQEGDYLIGADYGAYFLIEHGIIPDTAIGDFDSITPQQLEELQNVCREVVVVDPLDKDLTDAELAFDIALNRQPEQIVMFGVLGSRLDHSMANIQMMLRALQHQISSSIWDKNNFITLTGSSALVQRRQFTYVSLLPLTPEVTGITLEGFLYKLENASLRMGQSLGISNKLEKEEGTIQIESGLLLIIQSKD